MTQQPKMIDRVAQRMIDSEGADQADERERTVVVGAQAFGMQLTVLVCWLGVLLSMAWMSLIVWRQRRRAQRDEVEALKFD